MLRPVTSAAKRILHLALALSEGERKDLVRALTDSLGTRDRSSLSPEWTSEVGSRLSALESGEVGTVSLEEAIAQVERSLAGR